jgi:ATP/maltotriose-dependent transcriptional regulator MalT
MELLAKLDDGLERKLTCITAPTGFGKTTLVRMWLEERNYTSAWVTFDENDNDPVRFWTYVITAIRSLDTTLGKPAAGRTDGVSITFLSAGFDRAHQRSSTTLATLCAGVG